ncbi:MAG TPA: hypothetical protein VEK57_28660 [Thermoanaerobaculia bacterium]|nr:hypothetical protein [Thermoanaerobaculia bacterium]
MPRDMKEPQSYGSGEDWVTGKTGGKVNPQASVPPPEHRDFYESRRESETSAPDQGGRTPDQQLAESAEPAGHATGASDPVKKVTADEGGSKRDSYFRKRDYE